MKKPVEPALRIGVESNAMVITSHATKTIVNYTAEGARKYIIIANGDRIRMETPYANDSGYRYPVATEGRDLLRAIADGITEVLAVPVVDFKVTK